MKSRCRLIGEVANLEFIVISHASYCPGSGGVSFRMRNQRDGFSGATESLCFLSSAFSSRLQILPLLFAGLRWCGRRPCLGCGAGSCCRCARSTMAAAPAAPAGRGKAHWRAYTNRRSSRRTVVIDRGLSSAMPQCTMRTNLLSRFPECPSIFDADGLRRLCLFAD